MSRRHGKRRNAVVQFLVGVTECLLEMSPYEGTEACEALRTSDLPAGKYIAAMLAEIVEQHSATINGVYAMAVFSQVSLLEFLRLMTLLGKHFHLHDGTAIAMTVAIIGPSLCGLVSSALTRVAIGEDSMAAPVFVVPFTVMVAVHEHATWFSDPYFWPMSASLMLSFFLGAPAVRSVQRIAQLVRR